MSSKTDIFNLALTHLGMQTVSSPTDDTPSADTLNTFYTPAIDDLFSEYQWPFANVSAALVAVTDTVLGMEWDYIYVYPTQAAAVWNVYNEVTILTKDEQDFKVNFQVANNRRVICSNLSEAYAEYTYKVTDTTLFSPKFVIALSYKLAAMAAPTLLRDIQTSTTIMSIYNGFMQEAKRISFSECKRTYTPTSKYKNAR